MLIESLTFPAALPWCCGPGAVAHALNAGLGEVECGRGGTYWSFRNLVKGRGFKVVKKYIGTQEYS